MRKKPFLMTVDELVEPIERAITDIQIIKDDIEAVQKDYQIKSNFTYVFSLFECSINETISYLLCAIPNKLEFNKLDMKELKDSILNSTLSSTVLEHVTEKYVINAAYKSLDEYLKVFCELLGVQDIDKITADNLIEKKASRNLLTHNNMKVNSKYIKSAGKNRRSHKVGTVLTIDKSYLEGTINTIIEVLNKMLVNIATKYKAYTRKKLLVDIWNFLFNSPMLKFDNYWTIDSKTNHVSFNSIKAERCISNLSSYETTMLSIWMQQFSQTLASDFLEPRRTRMWIGMEDEVTFFATVVKKYPHIFQQV